MTWGWGGQRGGEGRSSLPDVAMCWEGRWGRGGGGGGGRGYIELLEHTETLEHTDNYWNTLSLFFLFVFITILFTFMT